MSPTPESSVTSPDPYDRMDAVITSHGPGPKGAGLPYYKCHKVVQAAKIKAVLMSYAGSVLDSATIMFECGATQVHVDAQWVSKHDPAMGGYYVLYAEGDSGYSPAHVFEKGYARLNDPSRPVPYQSDKLDAGEAEGAD
jgi:hypothetical protein